MSIVNDTKVYVIVREFNVKRCETEPVFKI
jgi:hypothetical protein